MLRSMVLTAVAVLLAAAAMAETAPSTPSNDAPTAPAYRDGQRDRKAWEDWFSGLAVGSYRDGASWWFDERTKDAPKGCASPSGDSEWAAGCRAAQQRLALPDIRWKTEAFYALGWESGPAADVPPEPITMSEAERTELATPAYLDGFHDRQTWEDWLLKLPTGSYRKGAFWWLDEHEKRNPEPCVSASDDAQWEAGCRAAQGRLAVPDVRRTTEADYRMGWISEASAPPSR